MKSNLTIIYCPYCGHKLIRKHLEGRKRLFCPNCEKIYYENPTPVVAIVVKDDKGRILLIKRKIDPCKGKWALPSGFMEIEETPAQGALRELREETGIIGEVKRLIGVYSNNSKLHGYLVTIVYEVKMSGGILCAGDDAEEAAFYEIEKMPDIVFDSHFKAIREVMKYEQEIEFRFIDK